MFYHSQGDEWFNLHSFDFFSLFVNRARYQWSHNDSTGLLLLLLFTSHVLVPLFSDDHRAKIERNSSLRTVLGAGQKPKGQPAQWVTAFSLFNEPFDCLVRRKNRRRCTTWATTWLVESNTTRRNKNAWPKKNRFRYSECLVSVRTERFSPRFYKRKSVVSSIYSIWKTCESMIWLANSIKQEECRPVAIQEEPDVKANRKCQLTDENEQQNVFSSSSSLPHFFSPTDFIRTHFVPLCINKSEKHTLERRSGLADSHRSFARSFCSVLLFFSFSFLFQPIDDDHSEIWRAEKNE